VLPAHTTSALQAIPLLFHALQRAQKLQLGEGLWGYWRVGKKMGDLNGGTQVATLDCQQPINQARWAA
jgi:hypothetical protein